MAKRPTRGRKKHQGVIVDRKGKTITLRSGRVIPLKPHHMPLTRRFALGLTDNAYRALRRLAEEAGIGNNYTLTVLLENAENTIDRRAFLRAVERMRPALAKPAKERGH